MKPELGRRTERGQVSGWDGWMARTERVAPGVAR
jgi:hypothetical protein